MFGLIVGLQGITATGWEAIGTIFIFPSIIVCLNILLDYLLTIDKIKKGLIYSCISAIIKIIIIIILIPNTIYEYKCELQYGSSNLVFNLILIISLIIITIPSIINTNKLIFLKRKKSSI